MDDVDNRVEASERCERLCNERGGTMSGRVSHDPTLCQIPADGVHAYTRAVPGSRRRREVELERVLGTPALFATAYGNVGSSIYYALGLTAVYTLGLTPVVFVVAGIVFAATTATYAGNCWLSGGGWTPAQPCIRRAW